MTRLDGNVSLPELLPRTGGYLWMHQGDGIVGWGEAARIDVGVGPGSFRPERREGSMKRSHVWARRVTDRWRSGASRSTKTPRVGADDPDELRAEPRRHTRHAFSVGEAAPPELTPRPSDPEHDFKIRYAGSTISEVEWLEAVARAVKSIASGDLAKVVLARDILIWSKQDFDVPILLERLARRFPECYTFAIDGLVGASPELLVRRQGKRVSSLVLAGTAPRAEGTADAELGRALLASEKDRHEHVLAVDSVRAPLEKLCTRLTVGEPELVRLSERATHRHLDRG